MIKLLMIFEIEIVWFYLMKIVVLMKLALKKLSNYHYNLIIIKVLFSILFT